MITIEAKWSTACDQGLSSLKSVEQCVGRNRAKSQREENDSGWENRIETSISAKSRKFSLDNTDRNRTLHSHLPEINLSSGSRVLPRIVQMPWWCWIQLWQTNCKSSKRGGLDTLIDKEPKKMKYFESTKSRTLWIRRISVLKEMATEMSGWKKPRSAVCQTWQLLRRRLMSRKQKLIETVRRSGHFQSQRSRSQTWNFTGNLYQEKSRLNHVWWEIWQSTILYLQRFVIRQFCKNVEGLKNIGMKTDSMSMQMDMIKEMVNIWTWSNQTLTIWLRRKKANKIENVRAKAVAYCDEVRSYFDVIRYHVDKLEIMVDDELWPLAKYRELVMIR